MATPLRCVTHSQKLFHVAFLDKQLLIRLPCSRISKTFCSAGNSSTEAHKNVDLNEHFNNNRTEDLNTPMNDSDTFGTLKISLEHQRNREKRIFEKQYRRMGIHNTETDIIKNKSSNSISERSTKGEDSDKFGTLTNESVWYTEMKEGEPGGESEVFIPDKTYKSPELYLREMKRLVKEKKIKEALKLFPDMKLNGITPSHANYTFMIGACGRVGYTEMAFKLLRQMTDRQMRPTPATLTGLFNSCAESPFPKEALEQINHLREKITQKNWPLSQPTYHAMIKAYGRCGDILSSFQVVDEMIKDGIHPNVETYSFLLMSCISDKEAGFTHAIEVWRKMLTKKIERNVYTFNLLLRATRDCGVGSEEMSSLLLQHWSSYKRRPYGFNKNEKSDVDDMLKLPNPKLDMIGKNSLPVKRLTSGDISTTFQDHSQYQNEGNGGSNEVTELKAKEVVEAPKIIANLLLPRPIDGPEIVDLLAIKTASDRLALLGNAKGFLQTMSENKVKPDIKTLMLLLECSPSTLEEEEYLLSAIETYHVVPDTDFFNILIKRRNLRNDFISAKKVLALMHEYNLSPDIVTFGVLALGCNKKKYGHLLLREMKNIGCHPNIEIMGALIYKATKIHDYEYLKDMLQVMKSQDIKPNEKVLNKIEDELQYIREQIIAKEQNKDAPAWITDTFCEKYYEFCEYYSTWLKNTEMQLEEHPWDQYKTEIILKVATEHSL